MMDAHLVDWQRHDPDNGLVQPWLVESMVDWLKKHDLSSKKILQYGLGLGDIWLAKRCKYLISIERNHEWAMNIQRYVTQYGVSNYEIHMRECNDNDGHDDYYVPAPISHNTGEEYEPDIVIVDDAYRLECIKYWIAKDRRITLIVDNYMQAFVFLNVEAQAALSGFRSLIFEEHRHTDNDGVNKWKTGVFFL